VIDHDGFLSGGLAATRGLTLFRLCKAAKELVNVTDSERKRTILNSYFGVPTELGARNGDNEDVLEAHCIPEEDFPERYSRILMTADSQKSPFGWYYGVRGYDIHGNNWLIDKGFVSSARNDTSIDRDATEKELIAIIKGDYNGQKINFTMIDTAGGSDAAGRARAIAKKMPTVYGYKGRGSQHPLHVKSPNNRKLILVNARQASDDLADAIYNQTNRDSNYMYLPEIEELEGEYLDHMLNIDPNNDTTKDKKLNDKFIRYDFWDIEKMLIVLSKYKPAAKKA